MNTVYHYTPLARTHFHSILASGVIRPEGETGIYTFRRPQWLCSAVWFSSDPVYEPTACKGIMDRGRNRTATVAEMLGQGAARFGIDAADLLTFQEYLLRAPAHYNLTPLNRKRFRRYWREMADGSMRMGADPAKWYVSLDPVRSSQWKGIEIYNSAMGQWIAAEVRGQGTEACAA